MNVVLDPSAHPDDNFHPPTDDDPWWTETCWFTFTVPERNLSAQLYPFFRPNQGVVAAGAYVWDPSGDQLWNCRYAKNFWHLPMPAEPLTDLHLPNGSRYRTLEPERRYHVAYDDPDGDALHIDVTFTAVAPPSYLGESHLDQPGRFEGRVVLDGEEIAVDGFGFRDRSWGHRAQFGEKLLGGFADNGGYSYATASDADAFHTITMNWGEGCRSIHGFLLRDGTRAPLTEALREVVERDGDGFPVRVRITGTDELGRTLDAEGTCRNRLVFPINPNLLTVNCLVAWEFAVDGQGSVTAFGEDHDNWSAASIRRHTRDARAADIRRELDHPVVDADGHLLEFVPLVRDLMGDESGGAVVDRFDVVLSSSGLRRGLGVDDRRNLGLARTGWWGVPARNTLDRATAMLPRLLHSRLDELGIDVAILYPTLGLTVMAIDDDELRRAIARACNRYYAEAYGPYRDRLLTVGVIPTYDPEEAIEELEHATTELGLRAFLFGGLVLRPAPGHEGDPAARWVDGLGLDSVHDYDPLWQRCVDLGVSPTFHSTGIGFGSRVSPGNYVANHVGNFAAGSEAVCRSLLFGGAMTRFPELRFAFLEGGAAWACNLFADVVGHFEKRNADALAHYDPAHLDRARLAELLAEHGDEPFTTRAERIDEGLDFLSDPEEDPATLDEWAQSGLRSVDDIVDVLTRRCFFGCEADDPMNALAFDTRINPRGTQLQAMFASDIGHWDVPDFTEVLPEAWELVEDGLLDAGQFRAFTFGNVARLFTATNPAFFAGTALEEAAVEEAAEPSRTGGSGR